MPSKGRLWKGKAYGPISSPHQDPEKAIPKHILRLVTSRIMLGGLALIPIILLWNWTGPEKKAIKLGIAEAEHRKMLGRDALKRAREEEQRRSSKP